MLSIVLLAAVLATSPELPLAEPHAGLWSSGTDAVVSASTGREFLVLGAQHRDYDWSIVGMRADETGHPIGRMFVVLSGDSPLGPLGLASDGNGYLLAYKVYGRNALMIARLDEQGHVTRSGSIAGAVSLAPVVWSGSAYVIGTTATDNTAIATVVDPDGTIVRSTPLGHFPHFQLANGPSDSVVMAWDGRDFNIHALVIPTQALRNGTLTPIADDTNPVVEVQPNQTVVASNRSGSIVVWTEFGEGPIATVIRALRLDRDGHPAGAPVVLAQLDHYLYRLAVTPSGTSFAVAYGDSQGAHVITDRAANLTSKGPVSTLALSGGDFGALLIHGDTLQGSFVSADGASMNETGPFAVVSQSQWAPSVMWCGNGYRAVWTESVSDAGQLFFGRMDVAGRPMDFEGHQIEGAHGAGLIACNESNSLVIWSDYSREAALRGAILEPDGTAHPAFDVGSRAGVARVLWNGSEYLVAWQNSDSHRIELRRIARDGSPIDAVPRVLQTVPESIIDLRPSIAWNGSEYLIAWSSELFSVFHPHHHAIYAVRLSRELAPVGTIRLLAAPKSEETGDATYPVVIAGNAEWGVAWSWQTGAGPYVTQFELFTSDLYVLTNAVQVSTEIPADGFFTGSGYRLLCNERLVTIEGGTITTSDMRNIPAVSHSQPPLMIVSRDSRLYAIPPSNTVPPVRRRGR